MNLSRVKRLIALPFYGWYIVVVGFFSIFVGVGATIDSMAVLVKPMSESLGWSRSLIMGAITLGSICSALVSPLVGRIVDRYGARILMPVSAVIGGLLLISLSIVQSPWQFYLLFGIGLGITRPCFSMVAATTTISNWFISKRGRALALTTMGAAISALVVIPLTQWIVSSYNWKAAWVMLGIMAWVILAIPAAVVIRRRPEDIGLLPDGRSAEDQEVSSTRESPGENGDGLSVFEENWSANQAIRTKTFWLILVSMVLTSFPVMGVWLHAIASFTDKGVSPAQAAFSMGCVAFTSIPSRLLFGMIAEKFHVRYCLIITNVGLAASVIFIMLADSFPLAVGSMLFYGVFVGGSIVLQAMVWPVYFGRLSLGAIQGYAELLRVVGNAGGPLLAGIIYDITGGYYEVFSAFAVGCLAAALLIYFAKQPRRPETV